MVLGGGESGGFPMRWVEGAVTGAKREIKRTSWYIICGRNTDALIAS